MTNPFDLLTPTELRTELGAAILELDAKATQVEKLRGEVARLTEALEKIAKIQTYPNEWVIDAHRRIARSALRRVK